MDRDILSISTIDSTLVSALTVLATTFTTYLKKNEEKKITGGGVIRNMIAITQKKKKRYYLRIRVIHGMVCQDSKEVTCT